MDLATNEYLKGIIEAILFISEKPIPPEQIAEAMDGASAADVRTLLGELQAEYESKGRGMVIVEIAGGYQMLSNPQLASYVRNFLKTKVKERLSRPALETLAIVAYKQPVSRGDVELIRGVNSDGVVLHLLNKGLIKIVGKKDVPGRPFLYGTAKVFLEYFGLKSLRDLPKLEDVSLHSLPSLPQGVVEAVDESATGFQEKAPEPAGDAASASLALDEAEARLTQDIAPKPAETVAASLGPEAAILSEALEPEIRSRVEDILRKQRESANERMRTLQKAMEDASREDLSRTEEQTAPREDQQP